MKFGLFYELQLPKSRVGDDWDADAERRIYDEMLDQVELADKVGFDYVFERRSTSSRAAGSSWARASRPRRWSWAASASTAV